MGPARPCDTLYLTIPCSVENIKYKELQEKHEKMENSFKTSTQLIKYHCDIIQFVIFIYFILMIAALVGKINFVIISYNIIILPYNTSVIMFNYVDEEEST